MAQMPEQGSAWLLLGVHLPVPSTEPLHSLLLHRPLPRTSRKGAQGAAPVAEHQFRHTLGPLDASRWFLSSSDSCPPHTHQIRSIPGLGPPSQHG